MKVSHTSSKFYPLLCAFCLCHRLLLRMLNWLNCSGLPYSCAYGELLHINYRNTKTWAVAASALDAVEKKKSDRCWKKNEGTFFCRECMHLCKRRAFQLRSQWLTHIGHEWWTVRTTVRLVNEKHERTVFITPVLQHAPTCHSASLHRGITRCCTVCGQLAKSSSPCPTLSTEHIWKMQMMNLAHSTCHSIINSCRHYVEELMSHCTLEALCGLKGIRDKALGY